MGPLPNAPGDRKFLLVATNSFTKWIKAVPLAKIRERDVKK